MTTLDKLQYLVVDSDIPEGIIEVWGDDEGTYGIDVGGEEWSNYLSEDEAFDQLECLIRGIKIGRQLM